MRKGISAEGKGGAAHHEQNRMFWPGLAPKERVLTTREEGSTPTEIVSPHFNIVKEIFSKNFVRRCRSELAYLTKLLAAYQIAKSNEFIVKDVKERAKATQ